MKAAEGSHFETCRKLLEAGAVVDAKNDVRNWHVFIWDCKC
jgi:hypothetical protein